MNYIIQKVTEEEESFLEGIVWKGPYNSDTTPEEKKIRQRFPFSEEGIQLAVAWLNEQREQGDWERL
ncbi:MAG: hypothetical protein ACLTKI_01980 [Lachnospiraceae bacterium]